MKSVIRNSAMETTGESHLLEMTTNQVWLLANLNLGNGKSPHNTSSIAMEQSTWKIWTNPPVHPMSFPQDWVFVCFPSPSSQSIIPYHTLPMCSSSTEVSFRCFCYFSLQVNILPFFHHLGSPRGPATFRKPQGLGIVLPLFCLTYRAEGCIRMHRINFGEVDRQVEGYLQVAKNLWVLFPNKKKKTSPSPLAATKKHCGLQ